MEHHNIDSMSPADVIKLYQPVIRKALAKISFPSVYRDDLIQEGNIALLKAFMSYDVNKGVPFSEYAFVVVRNRLLNFLRNLKKETSLSFNSFNGNDEVEPINFLKSKMISPEDALIVSEFKTRLVEFVKNSFTDEEKTILLHYFNGYSYKEIAEKMNVKVKRVDNVLLKIKRKLKAFFDVDVDVLKFVSEVGVYISDVFEDMTGENT